MLRQRITLARANCTCLVVHPDHMREILDAYEKLLAANLALLAKIYPPKSVARCAVPSPATKEQS